MEPSTTPSPSTAGPTTGGMSLGARLINVFSTPGDVFAEVKGGRSSTANWLVPVILSALVGLIATFVVFSQPSVVQQLREQQERAMEKKLEKLPKQQREQIMAASEKFMGPTVLKISGAVMAVFGSFAWLFAIALFIWLIGRFVLKGSFDYMQAVEVCGLAGMIGVLGGIVWMLLVVITGNIQATLGPALLIRDFDPLNRQHALLASVNVITLWYMGVLAAGLARLSGTSWLKGFLWLFVPWGAFKAAMILLNRGMFGA